MPAGFDRDTTATARQVHSAQSMLCKLHHSCLACLQALIAIHKPADAAALEAAKRRLAFEELLLLQLKLLLRREIDRSPRGTADLEGTCINQLDMMQAGRAALGFRLTQAQDRVLNEVCHPCLEILCIAYYFRV